MAPQYAAVDNSECRTLLAASLADAARDSGAGVYRWLWAEEGGKDSNKALVTPQPDATASAPHVAAPTPRNRMQLLQQLRDAETYASSGCSRHQQKQGPKCRLYPPACLQSSHGGWV